MQTAQTILAQLGGNRFAAMTGAKQFVGGANFLQFAIGRGAVNKANKVKVSLTADDLYRVEFFNIRGVNVKEIARVDGVYADQLQRVFTAETGFDTRL